VICEGKLLRGHFENAGELGHMLVQPGGRLCSCGQKGCLEAYSSAYFMARRAEEFIAQGVRAAEGLRRRGEMIMAEHVDAAARHGDELARQSGTKPVLSRRCLRDHAARQQPPGVVMAGGSLRRRQPAPDHPQVLQELTWKCWTTVRKFFRHAGTTTPASSAPPVVAWQAARPASGNDRRWERFMKKHRVAVIGCGSTPRAGTARTSFNNPRSELAVVCDVNARVARTSARPSVRP